MCFQSIISACRYLLHNGLFYTRFTLNFTSYAAFFFILQEPKNQYSHLDPAPPSESVAAGELLAAALQQGDAANLEDEELLRALQQTEEIGELEATDLMQFAYQIASGMVRIATCSTV